MHVSDALVSTPVALTGAAIAVGLLGIAGREVRKNDNSSIVPLMGVLGAFVFAAQMINFAIPGTGSSGHVIGGVLLAAFLGPWAAFITLASVLIIQCLVFADGGLLALGCNLINMGAMTTLVAYPLIFKPIAGSSSNPWRISIAAVIACTVGLELGACLVTLETMLSDVSALKWTHFLGVMAAIHLPIGFCEGLATAAVLAFVAKNRPDLLNNVGKTAARKQVKRAAVWFGIATVVIAAGLVWFASSNPDGLEWSVANEPGMEAFEHHHHDHVTSVSVWAGKISNTTSIMPDYENPLSGLVGAIMVLLIVWCLTLVLVKPKKKCQR